MAGGAKRFTRRAKFSAEIAISCAAAGKINARAANPELSRSQIRSEIPSTVIVTRAPDSFHNFHRRNQGIRLLERPQATRNVSSAPIARVVLCRGVFCIGFEALSELA
jgi:hypothetical protein